MTAPVVVSLRPLPGLCASRLLGLASVTLASGVTIHRVRIVQGVDGVFASFPAVRDGGEFYRVVEMPACEASEVLHAVVHAWFQAKEAQG